MDISMMAIHNLNPNLKIKPLDVSEGSTQIPIINVIFGLVIVGLGAIIYCQGLNTNMKIEEGWKPKKDSVRW